MAHRARYLVGLAVLAVCALAPAPAQASADPVSVVATGLDSPRGVQMLGALAVIAEAGHGGNTSQVSTVNVGNGNHTTLAGGLFSQFLSREGVSIGAQGVAVHDGHIFVIFGLNPEETGQQQAGQLGELNRATHTVSAIANVGQWDFNWTTTLPDSQPACPPGPPPCQEQDSNPGAVMVTGDGFLVADSGSNTLTHVSGDGQTFSVVHYFPQRYFAFPTDEVPTCLATGGGALWLGTLSGDLWRFSGGGVTQVVPTDANGHPLLTHVTGCTSSDGQLYLVNMFGSGAPFTPPPTSNFFRGSVVQYNIATGTGSELANSFTSPALALPYAPAVDPDGNLYVTAGTICPAGGGAGPCQGGGRLVKIELAKG